MTYSCSNCKHDGTTVCTVCCAYQGVPDRWEKKPQTNADRIRAMSDEELAHLLHSAEEHLFIGNLWDYAQWNEWLKQEGE